MLFKTAIHAITVFNECYLTYCMDACNGNVESETLRRTSIALIFSHQLNPNLIISQ